MKMKSICWSVVPLCCLVLAICARSEDGGTVKGSVTYTGPAVALPPIPIAPAKAAGCLAANVPDESLIVDPATKGIKYAMVRILDVKDDGKMPKPEKTPQIDQKGCTFSPHVLVIPPGTDFEVLNPDGINHNFHTTGMDFIHPGMNVAIAGAKKDVKGTTFKEPEIIQVACDIHGWMKAFIVLHDPRYCAVTGADGTFEIKNVPPGKYKVSVFHEKLGEKTAADTPAMNITVTAGGTVDASVHWDPKKK